MWDNAVCRKMESMFHNPPFLPTSLVYRAQRMAEMKALAAKSRFGDIIEITGYLSFGFYARMHVVYICA